MCSKWWLLLFFKKQFLLLLIGALMRTMDAEQVNGCRAGGRHKRLAFTNSICYQKVSGGNDKCHKQQKKMEVHRDTNTAMYCTWRRTRYLLRTLPTATAWQIYATINTRAIYRRELKKQRPTWTSGSLRCPFHALAIRKWGNVGIRFDTLHLAATPHARSSSAVLTRGMHRARSLTCLVERHLTRLWKLT